MPNYLIEVILTLMFLFFGIKYIKTRQFDDRKDIYTEESKRKAALIYGIFFIIAACLEAVLVVMKYMGIFSYSDNMLMSMLPSIGIFVGIIIVLIIVYAAVLKKK